jgi:hypothetical protein
MQLENLKYKQCNIELTFSLFWACSHSCTSGSTSSSSWFAYNDTWSMESLQSSIGPLSAGKDRSTTYVPRGTPKRAGVINCTAGLLRLHLRGWLHKEWGVWDDYKGTDFSIWCTYRESAVGYSRNTVDEFWDPRTEAPSLNRMDVACVPTNSPSRLPLVVPDELAPEGPLFNVPIFEKYPVILDPRNILNTQNQSQPRIDYKLASPSGDNWTY